MGLDAHKHFHLRQNDPRESDDTEEGFSFLFRNDIFPTPCDSVTPFPVLMIFFFGYQSKRLSVFSIFIYSFLDYKGIGARGFSF